MPKEKLDVVYKLFNDKSVRKKLTVMTKWDAMIDDARNPEDDFTERLEAFLKLGKSYRIRITVEEVQA
jgi:hypothetical protein